MIDEQKFSTQFKAGAPLSSTSAAKKRMQASKKQ
jgi:hypothetical protein